MNREHALTILIISLVFEFSLLCTVAQAGIGIHLDQDEYFVNPGEAFDAQVLLDANDLTLGDQPLASGLFSYGLRLTFNSIDAHVEDTTQINVPPELDFNGFDAGAIKDLGDGFAAVKGTIDAVAFEPYYGTLLATVSITDLTPPNLAPDYYTMNMEIYRTLGPSEQVFLDFTGECLDDVITFESATVIVAPPSPNCDNLPADMTGPTGTRDCYVDLLDFGLLSRRWLHDDCSYPFWCEGADMDTNGTVEIVDLSMFLNYWLWCTDPNDPRCQSYPP